MSTLALACREAHPVYRVTFAAGVLALAACFLVGLVYPVWSRGRPPGLSQDPLLEARRLLSEGALSRSIHEYEKGVLLSPGDPHGLSEWGRALGRSGDRAGELDAQTRALQLRPHDARLQADVAQALFRVGRHPEAIELWNRIVSRDPRDYRAWASLGEVWLEVDRYPEAVAAFSKSLEIGPRSAEVHNSLAIALNLQGRHDEALRHFRTAVALVPLAEFAANLEKAEAEAPRDGTPP